MWFVFFRFISLVHVLIQLLEKQETRVSGGTRKKRKRAVEDPATTPESTKGTTLHYTTHSKES